MNVLHVIHDFSLTSYRSLSVLIISLIFSGFSSFSYAQNLEISPNVSDSLSPTSYLIKVSGYGTFTPLIDLEVELISVDSTQTLVYSGIKSFAIGDSNTLTNFTYDPLTEFFSFDIGTYTNLNYTIHLISKENGEIKEELLIDTF